MRYEIKIRVTDNNNFEEFVIAEAEVNGLIIMSKEDYEAAKKKTTQRTYYALTILEDQLDELAEAAEASKMTTPEAYDPQDF